MPVALLELPLPGEPPKRRRWTRAECEAIDATGGKYASVLVYRENESIAPLAAPESPFRVAAAFEE